MQVPAELEELFAHFDKDCNGILDQEEMLSLVRFLVDANRVVHQGLNLYSASKAPLSVLSDFDWESFADRNGKDDKYEYAVDLVFLRQLLKKERQTAASPPVSSQTSASGSFTRVTSASGSITSAFSNLSVHLSAKSWPSLIGLDKNQQNERDDMIDALLRRGQEMIKAGVFAVPRLSWRCEEHSHPDDKPVLQMIGFLLDACKKHSSILSFP